MITARYAVELLTEAKFLTLSQQDYVVCETDRHGDKWYVFSDVEDASRPLAREHGKKLLSQTESKGHGHGTWRREEITALPEQVLDPEDLAAVKRLEVGDCCIVDWKISLHGRDICVERVSPGMYYTYGVEHAPRDVVLNAAKRRLKQ